MEKERAAVVEQSERIELVAVGVLDRWEAVGRDELGGGHQQQRARPLLERLHGGDLRRPAVGMVGHEDLARFIERLQAAAQPGQDVGHVALTDRRGLQQRWQRDGGRITVVEARAAGVARVRRRRWVGVEDPAGHSQSVLPVLAAAQRCPA